MHLGGCWITLVSQSQTLLEEVKACLVRKMREVTTKTKQIGFHSSSVKRRNGTGEVFGRRPWRDNVHVQLQYILRERRRCRTNDSDPDSLFIAHQLC